MATCIQLAIETFQFFQYIGRISINFFIYVQLLYVFLNVVSFSRVKKYLVLFSPCSCQRARARIIIPFVFLHRKLLDFPGPHDSER